MKSNSDAYWRKRSAVATVRISWSEMNELTNLAAAMDKEQPPHIKYRRKITLSWLIRAALQDKYPQIFKDANRKKYFAG